MVTTDIIISLVSNRVGLGCLLAWTISQSIKVLLLVHKKHSFKPEWIVKSGGMPSSHAAVLTALTLQILFKEHVSSLFILSLVISIALIWHLVGNHPTSHSLKEVMVGACIGVFAAIIA